MLAWQVQSLGEPAEALRLVDVAPPDPAEGELLVRIEVTALNFPDLLLCRGTYQERPDLPFTPGLEACGLVVGGHRDGERVLVSPRLPHGALAELVTVPEEEALTVPAELDPSRAAALQTTYQTGWAGLHLRAGLRAGETLLVHAGAGGVGSAAIQIGKAAGARVIATAGGPRKVEVCRDLGADVVIDYLSDDFVEVVKEVTGGVGADVIYDSVGGEIFDRSRKCIAFEGRIVVVGFAGGEMPQAPTNHLLVKNYSVVGLHYGLYRKLRPEIPRQVHESVLDLWRAGLVDPLLGEQVAMDEVPAALARLGSRGTIGKVTVRVG